MFPPDLLAAAQELITTYRAQGLKIALAESCTGGLATTLLTEIAGASDVVDRAFVTYSNDSKSQMLGVPTAVIERHGAVSAAVALAMVEGSLSASKADVALSVTGIAGPSGGTDQKPVGLVYIAAHRKGRDPVVQRFNFANGTRASIRLDSARELLKLAIEAVKT